MSLSIETTPALPDEFGGGTPITYELLNAAAVPEFEVKGSVDDFLKQVDASGVPDGSFRIDGELALTKLEIPPTAHDNFHFLYSQAIISSADADAVLTAEGFGAVQYDFFDWDVSGLDKVDEVPLVYGAIVAHGDFRTYQRTGDGINKPQSNTELVLEPGDYSIDLDGAVSFRSLTREEVYNFDGGLLEIVRY